MTQLGQRFCPTGCGRPIRTGMLTCRDCWHQVPKHLQRAVWNTWRAWKADFGNEEKMQRWEEASEAALAAIR